ncbi:MAG: radical SAM protein [Clostridiales bacterium]|nr:radical SAM protein [Clostridiales bacterium]
MKKSNISVFVPHIGCPHKCSFCNQNTITGQSVAPSGKDVRKAVEIALNSNTSEKYEYEIAFFGGSFTAVEHNYMVSLLEAAKPYVDNGSVKGIRISTRPDFINAGILNLLKEYGVTAVELGAQCMNNNVLEANFRGHTVQNVQDAARLIKEYNFELGLQMMTGLYSSNDDIDFLTAVQFAALNPDTVRIYPTVILKDTYLAFLFEKGEYIPRSLDSTVSLCARLVEYFEKNNIEVIRVGLHASDDVKRNMLCGGYHESLGEMVASRMMYNKITSFPAGEYKVYINRKSISKLLGNKKSNIAALKNACYNIEIMYDDKLGPNELRVE